MAFMSPVLLQSRFSWLLAIAMAVLYVGWVKFLFGGNTVYLLDYAFRIVCIVLIFVGGKDALLHPPRHLLTAIAAILQVLLIFWAIFWLRWFFFIPDPWFFSQLYPELPDGPLLVFDLTFGLALVALSEEGVFRYLFARVWSAGNGGNVSLYVVSSIAFGLLHLPQGAASVAIAFLSGFLLMWLYRKCGSLWPPMIAHYLVDLILFSDAACWLGVGGC